MEVWEEVQVGPGKCDNHIGINMDETKIKI